jgi:16S rRNA (cytosine1402-N4)-methyltransferase
LRGFSFQKDGPLDMRFDPSQDLRAADLVNDFQLEELARVIHQYGEEPKAYRIAKAIVRARPLEGTLELAELVSKVVGRRKQRIHPATRTFQALRIAVNDELDSLRIGLARSIDLLEPGGRMAVISFHSLEDRIVKQTFREASRVCVCPPEQPICTCDNRPKVKRISRRPIRPKEKEIELNPRARSARLRVIEKQGMA